MRNGSSLCFVETSVRPAHARCEAAVEIGVHEMRVHDVGAQRAHETGEEQRIDIARRAQTRTAGTVERAVEVGRIPRGIVEPDEHGVDAALRERRQQREQMPLGAADPAHAVDVDDSHRVRTRRTIACKSRRCEQCEQEVPRDAVARRADEAHGAAVW